MKFNFSARSITTQIFFAQVLVHCVKTVTGIWKYIVERETVYTCVLLKLVLMLNKARLRLQRILLSRTLFTLQKSFIKRVKWRYKKWKNNRTYINGLAGPEHYFATLSYVGLSHARLGLLTLGLISIVWALGIYISSSEFATFDWRRSRFLQIDRYIISNHVRKELHFAVNDS